MKPIISILISIITLSAIGFSQCTIDPNLTEVGFYPSPDSLDCIERTVNYSGDIQFVTPATFDTLGLTLTIDTIAISSFTGLPNGISYSCNPSTCKIIGGQSGCINLSGVTNDPAGQYPLNVVAEVTVTIPFLGQQKQIVDLSSLGIVYYLTVIEQGSGCRAAPTASVSGKITSETGVNISSVTVSASGDSSPSDLTDTSGNYSLQFNPGDSVTVIPSKINDVTTNNGITTLDIIIVRRHLLAVLALSSPYKIIAADVNASASVTTLDLLFMRSIILQIVSSFPNGKLWSFVPDDYVFPDTLNPFSFPGERSYPNLNSDLTDQNFIGIKLGDVNNDWNPGIAKTNAVGEIQFMMDEQHVLRGQEIIVPVKVKDFKNVTGYQFTLAWDPDVLELVDVNNKSLNGYYGKHKAGEGFLTTSWDDEMVKGISLKDDDTVFELKFKVIGENGTSSEIKIGSTMTVGEAYNENLDLLNIAPTNGMVKVADGSPIVNQSRPAGSIINLQVQPNPFTNSTNITFIIPEDEIVAITIYDALGKVVRSFNSTYEAGANSLVWIGDNDSGRALTGGVYLIRLTAGAYSTSSKAVLIR